MAVLCDPVKIDLDSYELPSTCSSDALVARWYDATWCKTPIAAGACGRLWENTVDNRHPSTKFTCSLQSNNKNRIPRPNCTQTAGYRKHRPAMSRLSLAIVGSWFGFSQTKSRTVCLNPDLRLKRSPRHPGHANQVHLLEFHPALPSRPLGVDRCIYRNHLV